MDEARWGAVFQTVNGCAAHSSPLRAECSLVTLKPAHLSPYLPGAPRSCVDILFPDVYRQGEM